MPIYGSESDQLTIITTCVNYDDFLSLTLPHMIKWGRVIVVSNRHDFETGKVAAKHGAELFCTDAWYKDNSKFNKGAALNEAIAHANPQGWLLSVDADTLLLPQPLESNNISMFDKEIMYGSPRRMCYGVARWNQAIREQSWYEFPIDAFPPIKGKNKKKGKPGKLWGSRPTANPVGVQGYFQLWHWPTHPHKLLEYHNAAMYDVELALNWEDHKRVVMPWPDYSVLHLGLRKVNWKGRESVRWDGDPIDLIPEGDLEQAAMKFHG
jgi:hypothetical protein